MIEVSNVLVATIIDIMEAWRNKVALPKEPLQRPLLQRVILMFRPIVNEVLEGHNCTIFVYSEMSKKKDLNGCLFFKSECQLLLQWDQYFESGL